MIRFSDVTEKGTSPEKIEKHSDIKPSGGMTDQEADAFWKAEFQKAHDEVSLDEYDTLLSEVFNRSEDELDIDFVIGDKLVKLLDQFSPETWEYMDDSERYEIISEFVSALSEDLGLEDIPEVAVFDDDVAFADLGEVGFEDVLGVVYGYGNDGTAGLLGNLEASGVEL